MARHKNAPSTIQNDPKLFGDLCAKIKRIGMVKLDSYRLVSRTTIFYYVRGKEVPADVEQAILDSVELWEAEQREEANRRADQARKLVSL